MVAVGGVDDRFRHRLCGAGIEAACVGLGRPDGHHDWTAAQVQRFDRGTSMGAFGTWSRVSNVQQSGPYTWVEAVNAAFLLERRVYDASRQATGSVDAVGNFGSLVWEHTSVSPAAYRVVDAADASVAPISFGNPAFPGATSFYPQYMWGDWTIWNVSTSAGPAVGSYNYRTQETHLFSPTSSGFGGVVGDGFASVRNYTDGSLSMVNFVTGAVVSTLPAGVGQVASDGWRHVAFSTSTDVVVRTLDGVGLSAPRLLGAVSSGSLDLSVAGQWSVDVDASKPLAAGVLVIRDGSGTTVRSLSTPASSDGSLRGLSWDGTDTSGAYVSAGSFSWELQAAGADGTGTIKSVDGLHAASGVISVTGTPSVVSAPGMFRSLSPARLLDTRSGNGGSGPVAAFGTVSLQVTGRGGVPASGVAAVVMNVTVTQPGTGGFITAFPSGTSMPTASNLNFVAGQTIPNLVVVKVGSDGKVNLTNNSGRSVQLVADVAGYYLAGTPTDPGAFVSLAPARLLDTRSGNGATGPVAAFGTVGLQVAGRGGVPASGVAAVVMNVTVTQPGTGGFVTVFPSGTTMPTASNLNFVAGQTIPNLATVKVGSDGKVNLTNNSGQTVQLVADVAGYYLAGTPTAPGAFVSLAPARLLDSRSGNGATGPVSAFGTVGLQVTGRGGVPASGVAAVVANVTVTQPGTGGFITAYPAGTTMPTASNLNFVAGQTIPNLTSVKVGAGGKVNLTNNSGQTVQLIADVAGYYLSCEVDPLSWTSGYAASRAAVWCCCSKVTGGSMPRAECRRRRL